MSRHGDNIFRRKDKRWEGRYICGRTEDGRARYKSVYAHSYAECRQKLDAHQTAAEFRGRRMTVSQLFEIWLESRKNSVKLSTYTNYRTLYTNHIKSVLGGLPCESITAEMLNKYVSSLTESGNIFGGEFSANSVKAVMIIIKSMFKYGSCEYGFTNPAQKLTLPKTAAKEIDIFDDDEIITLYGLSESDDQMLLGIVLCLCTGIRIGEVCALKWADIDLDGRVLHIGKTLQRIKNPTNSTPRTLVTITEPKSRKSTRDIPIPAFLLPVLQKLRCNSECYFLTASPSFTEPRTLSFKYKKCLRELGIKYRNFHCLRHTFATKCIRVGVDIKTLSELLGHSSVQITLDRYVHSDLEVKRIQIEKLSAELFSKL